jgi:hypothetical protein
MFSEIIMDIIKEKEIQYFKNNIYRKKSKYKFMPVHNSLPGKLMVCLSLTVKLITAGNIVKYLFMGRQKENS